jgi:DNA-directed RNA polymerase specialized sigma24 family protein
MNGDPYPPDLIDGYPRLRRKLVLFFDRRRAPGEELADETLLRVVKRFADGRPIDSLDGFVLGVAHHVYADWTREQGRPVATSVVLIAPAGTAARCLRRCMQEMQPEERELLEAYFIDKADRRALAGRLGLSLNALRQKVCKVKKRLRSCLDNCARRSDA